MCRRRTVKDYSRTATWGGVNVQLPACACMHICYDVMCYYLWPNRLSANNWLHSNIEEDLFLRHLLRGDVSYHKCSRIGWARPGEVILEGASGERQVNETRGRRCDTCVCSIAVASSVCVWCSASASASSPCVAVWSVVLRTLNTLSRPYRCN